MQTKANTQLSTQARERTRLKRTESDRCGDDMGANSTVTLMFEEEGRGTRKKIHHCAGYAS